MLFIFVFCMLLASKADLVLTPSFCTGLKVNDGCGEIPKSFIIAVVIGITGERFMGRLILS